MKKKIEKNEYPKTIRSRHRRKDGTCEFSYVQGLEIKCSLEVRRMKLNPELANNCCIYQEKSFFDGYNCLCSDVKNIYNAFKRKKESMKHKRAELFRLTKIFKLDL